MSCLSEVPADVLRTCLGLTRHSSLWMNDVYRNVHDQSESGVNRRASSYTRACTARPPLRRTSAQVSGFIEVYGVYALNN